MAEITPMLRAWAAPPHAYRRFCDLRRQMAAAFADWLREHPHAADVADEIEATAGVLRGVRDLAGDGA